MENKPCSNPGRDERDLAGSFIELEQHPLQELKDNEDGRTSPENITSEDFTESSREGNIMYSLTGIYAEVLIVVTAICIIAEMLPGSLPLFHFHNYIFVYLLGMGITIFVIIQAIKFHQQNSFNENDRSDGNHSPVLQITTQDQGINVFFKVGASITGAVVLVTSLLEAISMHLSMKQCVDLLGSAQPILRCIFVLFEIHFLVSPKDIFNTLGCFRNIAIMHLFAVNVCLWFRMMFWGIVKDWEIVTHVKHNSSVLFDDAFFNVTVHSLESDVNSIDKSAHYPAHVIHYTGNCYWRTQKSDEIDVTSVQYCLKTSTLGHFWVEMDEFLFVFKTQYYFLIVGILYIIWCKYSNDCIGRSYSLFSFDNQKNDLCSRATKGFCLGVMIFVTSFIVFIIFFTVNKQMIMIHSIIYCIIFGSSSFSAIFGVFQVKKMFVWEPPIAVQFIRLFQSIGLFAVLIYGTANMISGSTLSEKPIILIAFESISMVLNGIFQYILIVEVSRRKIDVSNARVKPGRQAVVFLIICNISLFILESFVTWSHLRHQHIITGSEAIWPIIIRCVLPFVVFYRYHSAVTLTKAWLKAYQ